MGEAARSSRGASTTFNIFERQALGDHDNLKRDSRVLAGNSRRRAARVVLLFKCVHPVLDRYRKCMDSVMFRGLDEGADAAWRSVDSTCKAFATEVMKASMRALNRSCPCISVIKSAVCGKPCIRSTIVTSSSMSTQPSPLRSSRSYAASRSFTSARIDARQLSTRGFCRVALRRSRVKCSFA